MPACEVRGDVGGVETHVGMAPAALPGSPAARADP
jgi:hypothetical protein